jgi:hypothetical protein
MYRFASERRAKRRVEFQVRTVGSGKARRCGGRTPTAVALIALLAACATPTAKPPEQAAADLALADRVYLALNADPWFYFRHVDVRVDDGVADLSGYVWSADALYQARRIAANVPGVRRVVTSNLDMERNGLANGMSSR